MNKLILLGGAAAAGAFAILRKRQTKQANAALWREATASVPRQP